MRSPWGLGTAAHLVTTDEVLTEFLAAVAGGGTFLRQRAAAIVRAILADAGWARAFRDSAPVVARCDTGEILWIIGLAQAESSRVTAVTFSSPRAPNLICLTAEFGC